MMKENYVHGYSEEEAHRLLDQASTLADLLHEGTRYSAGNKALENSMNFRCLKIFDFQP